MLLCAIKTSKHQYYSRISKKLMDSSTSVRSYWFLLRTFLNNKKIRCIPPLVHNNEFIPNFRNKAELFNNYFAKQCALIDCASEIPAKLNMKTTKTLSSIPVTTFYIPKIIKKLILISPQT